MRAVRPGRRKCPGRLSPHPPHAARRPDAVPPHRREGARPRRGGGRAVRPPQVAAPGPVRRVRRAQGVRAGRRAQAPRLEGLRQVRPVLHQALRARDEPARADGRRCVGQHGLRHRGPVEAGRGEGAGRDALAPLAPPAGRRGRGAHRWRAVPRDSAARLGHAPAGAAGHAGRRVAAGHHRPRHRRRHAGREAAAPQPGVHLLGLLRRPRRRAEAHSRPARAQARRRRLPPRRQGRARVPLR